MTRRYEFRDLFGLQPIRISRAAEMLVMGAHHGEHLVLEAADSEHDVAERDVRAHDCRLGLLERACSWRLTRRYQTRMSTLRIGLV